MTTRPGRVAGDGLICAVRDPTATMTTSWSRCATDAPKCSPVDRVIDQFYTAPSGEAGHLTRDVASGSRSTASIAMAAFAFR